MAVLESWPTWGPVSWTQLTATWIHWHWLDTNPGGLDSGSSEAILNHSQKWSEVKWKSLSRVRLFATPWTIQSMEFSRPEYWSGQHFPSPGDLPNPRIEPRSPALQADSLPIELSGKPTLQGHLQFFWLKSSLVCGSAQAWKVNYPLSPPWAIGMSIQECNSRSKLWTP